MFKTLTVEEEHAYRAWARGNYKPLDKIKEFWHPVIQAECAQINIEARRPPVCSVCGEELEGVNLMAPAIHRETSEPCCGTQCSNRPSIRTFDPATGEFCRFYRRYHDQDGNRLGASNDGLPFYSPSYTKEQK